MKPIKIIVLVALIGIATDFAFRVIMSKREPPREAARLSARNDAPVEVLPRLAPVPSPELIPQPLPTPVPAESTNAVPQIKARPKAAAWPPNQIPPLDKQAAYVVARVALGFVGADSDAEEYWIAAINNPTFSRKQREDLIEDLNEEGFADPKNPTAEELPLIVNRLALIEDIAADAMDEVNAAAFQEAYKDLVNMFVRLTR